MIIENRRGMVVLYSEGSNKITNKARTMFVNRLFIGKNDPIDDFEEVPKDVWCCYVKEEDPEIEVLKENVSNMTDRITDISDKTMGLSDTIADLNGEVLTLFEDNVMRDELILTSMDALAENYEFALTIQEDNLMQDELILASMDALAESYEQTLVIEENTTENTENILILTPL